VLVVGPGTTGSEVAAYLAKGGAGRVRVACRTPPNLVTRKILGSSINISGIVLDRLPVRVGDELSWLSQRIVFGDLERYGLPRSPNGLATTMRHRQQAPAYAEKFVPLLRAGRIQIVAAVEGFDGPDVLLADGTRIQPQAVIAATGYRRGLEPLVGHLGVLGEDGIPLVSGGKQHPSAPGLFFNGYRPKLSGHLRPIRAEARAIARTVRRHRR
jgi:putative flavoprotein involved in K+ transport